jgi:tetratricopeptide (TPR) repeat protein
MTAIEQYQAVLESKPNFEKTHYNLAKALELKGRLSEAIAHYKKTLELEPSYIDARSSLANALAQQGENEEAAAQFGEVPQG